MFRLLVGLLAATVPLAGCSFILVDRAPPRDQWPRNGPAVEHEQCSAEPIPPILDGLSAAVAATLFVYGRQQEGAIPGHVLLLPAAIAWGVSSLYGFAAVSTCRTYLSGPPYVPVAAPDKP